MPDFEARERPMLKGKLVKKRFLVVITGMGVKERMTSRGLVLYESTAWHPYFPQTRRLEPSVCTRPRP